MGIGIVDIAQKWNFIPFPPFGILFQNFFLWNWIRLEKFLGIYSIRFSQNIFPTLWFILKVCNTWINITASRIKIWKNMKYPNSQKGLFRASVYYRGGEQQQSIGKHLLFLLYFLQRLAIKKMVKVGKLRM